MNYSEEFISKLKHGNRLAQKELFEKTYGKMLAVCARYSSNTEEAKDMVQDGYFKAFTKINNFQNKTDNIEGWIYRIMVNICLNNNRKKKEFFIELNKESEIVPEHSFELTEEASKIDVNVLMKMIQSFE